ncbi:MAG: hypothetical protein AAFX76_12165, partial [Planctomycetota bacterium]
MRPSILFVMTVVVGTLIGLSATPRALALNAEHQAQARAAIDRGLDYLRQTQNADGSWSPQPG